MKNRFAFVVLAALSLTALSVEPDVQISFNKGVQADVGGTGNTGSVLEGFRDPIGMKGTVIPSGKLKDEELLVPGIEGKGVKVGRIGGDGIYKIIYKPLPALSRTAGSVSVWVRPDNWDGTDTNYHTFFSAANGQHRIFLYRTPGRDLCFCYGDISKKLPSTRAQFPAHNWKKGQWHHLCIAYDEKTMELHIDGVRKALVPMVQVFPSDFNTIILGEHWIGDPGITTIDDLRIYNGVRLTSDQMKAEYRRFAKNSVSGAPMEFCAAPCTATVDGEVKADEYSIGGNGFLSVNKNYYSSIQAKWLLAYDQDNLYIGMISDKATVTTQTGRDSTPYVDDSIELYVSDIYGGPDMFHFIFNFGTGFFDRKNEDVNWNSQGVVFQSRTVQDKWHFEASIPWSNFGIKPEDGRTLKLNICRTYAAAAEYTQIAPSGRKSYSDKAYFAQLKLMKNAPKLELTGFGQLNAAKLDCAILVKSDEDDTITWGMEALDNFKPFIFSRDLKLAPNAAVTEKCVREIPKDRTLEITVSSQKHGMIYHNSIEYHNAIALDHSYIYTDIPNDKVVFVYKNNSLNSGKHKLHAAFVRKDGSVEYEETVDIPDDTSITNGIIDVSRLTPGTVYDLRFQVKAPDGKEIINSQEEYGYFKNGAPWKDTKFGLESEDAALPPWPPVKAGATGVFQCWGRECTFGGKGIISSFTSQEKQLLTAPIALVANGSPVEFKATLDSACDARALYTLNSAGPISIEVKVRAEFDGMMYFEVELGDGDYQSLQLKIPLDRNHADAFDDCSSIIEKLSFRDNPKPHYDCNFVQNPFWWCGGDEIGLMGGTQSKRGWRIKDKSQSMTIDLDDKTVLLTLNMIDTPIRLNGKRKLTFYLDGTPVKPRRMDTARVRERNNVVHFAISGKYFGYYQPDYLTDFARWIQRRVKQDNRIDVDKMQYFAYFPAKGAGVLSPAWHYYATRWVNPPPPMGTYAMKTGVFRNSSWTWTCLNEKTHFDFQLSNIQTILTPHKHNFCNAGIYFDLAWPRVCGNTCHGCAWKDEFGDVQQDNDIYALRDFYIRSYRMLKKERPDAYYWGHTYLSRTPTDAIFDLCIAGEMYDRHLGRHGTYYDVLTPELMRIAYGSRVAEHSFSLIPQFLRGLQCYNPENVHNYNPLKPEWDKPLRHFLAYMQLHRMYPVYDFWMANEKLSPKGEGKVDKLYAALDDLGWEDVKFYGYFQKSKPLVCLPEHPRVIASAYTNGNKLFLVALNDTDQARKVQVTLNSNKLASFRNMAGTDAFSKKDYRLENGSITLDLEGRDSAFILFK
ncbi:MAG: hypothetical protein IJJ33_03255 [Victivallales bacterium]|nr:hypothetical protein [Victivallales bacterium]